MDLLERFSSRSLKTVIVFGSILVADIVPVGYCFFQQTKAYNTPSMIEVNRLERLKQDEAFDYLPNILKSVFLNELDNFIEERRRSPEFLRDDKIYQEKKGNTLLWITSGIGLATLASAYIGLVRKN